MMRVIRSELTRLRSRSFLLGGIGLMAVFGVMATVIVFFAASNGSTGGLPGTQGVTLGMVEASNGMFAGLRTFVSMLGIVALVTWAMAFTSDYSTGLIRLLVQAEPRRLRLLGGKVVALALFTCLATLVTTLVVLLVSPAAAGRAGVSAHAWGTDLLGTLVGGYLHLTLSVLLWGVAGMFIGVLTCSTGISIAVGIGYLLVFEGVVGMVLKSGLRWLPGSTFSAIASGGSADMAFGVALLVAAAYAVAAIAIAAVTFRRRDITA